MRSCIRRIFKTATAACWFFQPCSACTRFCKNSLLTAATKGRSCKRLWPKRFRISNLKSSNAPIMQKASRFSHDVGSSNVPSHGSTDADDWPRILKTSHATHWHSCVSRQSELCSERFVINNQLLGQTLSISFAHKIHEETGNILPCSLFVTSVKEFSSEDPWPSE